MTREEAISKLNTLIRCAVDRAMIDEICHEIIEFLESQMPRVMTLEEIKDNIGVPVWIEYADNEIWNGYGVPTSDHEVYIMIFGANAYCVHNARSNNVSWRCWTSRPFPEQMRDTPWEVEDAGSSENNTPS